MLELDLSLHVDKINGVGEIADVGLHVEQIEEPLGRRGRLMDIVELVGEPLNRLKELAEVEVEGDDLAGRQPVLDPEIEDQGERRDVDEGDEGTVDPEAEHDVKDRAAVSVVLLVELLRFLFLAVEDLRDLHARQVFVQESVEVGETLALVAESAALVVREEERSKEDHRDRDQHQAGEPPTDDEHDRVDADDRDDVADDRNDDVGEQVAHRLGVRGDAGDERADRHLGKLILAHSLDVGEHVAAERVDDPLPRLLEHHRFDVDEKVVQRADDEGSGGEHDHGPEFDDLACQRVGDAREEQRDHDIEPDV